MKKNGKRKEFTGVTGCGEETVARALPLCEGGWATDFINAKARRGSRGEQP
jgi:hypothetical protein